ncbi:hypothetical protein [Moraxella lacunata]
MCLTFGVRFSFACFINRPELYFIAGLFANKGNGFVIDAGVCYGFDF